MESLMKVFFLSLSVPQASDLDPTQVVSTLFSTFSYFLTSLVNGKTVTRTDIVVSTQVVTERLEATPTLVRPSPSPGEVSLNDDDDDLATKTYFTTSTYYTTLIDGRRTLTRTRTKVKSSVVTEPASYATRSTIRPSKVDERPLR